MRARLAGRAQDLGCHVRARVPFRADMEPEGVASAALWAVAVVAPREQGGEIECWHANYWRPALACGLSTVEACRADLLLRWLWAREALWALVERMETKRVGGFRWAVFA